MILQAHFISPTHFLPNGDNEDDALKIYYRNYDCIDALHLIIYDRWGEKVFETDNHLFEWSGMYKGKTLDTQVLAYSLYVKFTDGNILNRKGNFSLIR